MANLENQNDENESSTPDATELQITETDLKNEIESDEDELPPPEDVNEAREINVGNILAVIFIAIAVILMIVMIAGGKKSKKESASKELDKAGSKFEFNFNEKTAEIQSEIPLQNSGNNADRQPPDKDNVDDILATLPESLQPAAQPVPAQAPVAPVGSRGYSSTKSTRPDTRNSKSPRKIDGIKGQASPDTNQNIVSAVLNGNFTPGGSLSGNQRMSKDEYIAQMMKQTQSIQSQMYGNSGGLVQQGGQSAASAYQQNKEQFYSNGAGNGGDGQYMSFNSLWDGTVISGALVTAINTDNPGVVIARVTENVYSSYDHSFLLIPEGSLLYATYNSSVSYGQNKVQVAWNLLIRPDGYRIVLGNMNGVNAQGESGYRGKVNNHPFETLKALGMIAVYSMIQTEITNDINSQNNEYLQNAMTDVYTQSAKIGNKIIDRALDIKPTITIKAGTEIKLITNTPLELPPVQINKVTRKYVRTR